MAHHKTPGVYVGESPNLPPGVAPVDTAIPAFVGYTERATADVTDDLSLKPTRIESMTEFEQCFGRPQPETGMKVEIIETTVANPGQPVGVRSSAHLDEAARSKHILHYAMQLFYANGGRSAYVVSVGGYKTIGAAPVTAELLAGVEALGKVDGPTLIVVPEAQALSLSDYARVNAAALDQSAEVMDRFVIMDLHGGTESLTDPGADLLAAVANFRGASLGTNLQYGAVYGPNLETVLDPVVDDAEVQVTHIINGSAAAAVPLTRLGSQLQERARAAIRNRPLKLPPSGAIAGVYAKVDTDRGVWKAPANVALVAVDRPTTEVSSSHNDAMNIDPVGGKSINAIRWFAGKGTLVWGARTLAGNNNEWRYVSVRRFCTFVENSVKQATGQFTFEPNDANTWTKTTAMIETFLTTQWRQGALQGAKPEQAFYVSVGLGRTMTELDIREGRMIVEIGMAVVRPAEFTILRFSHKMAQG